MAPSATLPGSAPGPSPVFFTMTATPLLSWGFLHGAAPRWVTENSFLQTQEPETVLCSNTILGLPPQKRARGKEREAGAKKKQVQPDKLLSYPQLHEDRQLMARAGRCLQKSSIEITVYQDSDSGLSNEKGKGFICLVFTFCSISLVIMSPKEAYAPPCPLSII